MVGAHFDSWHSGTGATDNGAGSAVMIEVMRILKTLNLKLDRTVRIALWGGEEQGLLGSRAYVGAHFADLATMELRPEHGKLSGYFNLDNGSGRIRGVYLQEHEAMRPLFEQWLAPFRDLGVTTISIRNTGGPIISRSPASACRASSSSRILLTTARSPTTPAAPPTTTPSPPI